MHWSAIVKKELFNLKELGIQHIFLPWYTPEFSPIERYWSLLKREYWKLMDYWGQRQFNYEDIESKTEQAILNLAILDFKRTFDRYVNKILSHSFYYSGFLSSNFGFNSAISMSLSINRASYFSSTLIIWRSASLSNHSNLTSSFFTACISSSRLLYLASSFSFQYFSRSKAYLSFAPFQFKVNRSFDPCTY